LLARAALAAAEVEVVVALVDAAVEPLLLAMSALSATKAVLQAMVAVDSAELVELADLAALLASEELEPGTEALQATAAVDKADTAVATAIHPVQVQAVQVVLLGGRSLLQHTYYDLTCLPSPLETHILHSSISWSCTSFIRFLICFSSFAQCFLESPDFAHTPNRHIDSV